MQIELSLTQLRAALLAAAKQDIRYYLNGVYVEASPTRTRVVSTNGHILYIQDSEEENTWSGSMIVPRSILETVTKGTFSMNRAWIQVTEEATDDHAMKCTIKTGAMMNAIEFSPIQGVFPDYTRVIPVQRESTEAAQFNPEYIGIWAKVAKVLGSKSGRFTLHHNGPQGSALVTFSDTRALGVMMPVRNDATGFPDTSTLRAKLATTEAREPEDSSWAHADCD